MTARILIVDAVPTNRIVLKVKMQTAQFRVTACATRIEAEQAMMQHRPDLMLINLSSIGADLFAFCRGLRDNPVTRGLAIIAMGGADTARARFAALDAGADDVLPAPVEDAYLLARIRSLLRIKSAGQELALRESTSRALGFDDARSPFSRTAKIRFAQDTGEKMPRAFAQLAEAWGPTFQTSDIRALLALGEDAPRPDLVILDLRKTTQTNMPRFDLVSELRSRTATRLSALMVILPRDGRSEAAMHLDLGAEDVVFADVSGAELDLRIRALVGRKLQQDGLRATVRDGLQAALTDPLTGLYNRRYLMPHLTRMAEEALSSERQFAVMMIDIDHFKAINDTHGHAAGDQVLVGLADRLRDNLRAVDLLGRIGGEEFLVAMPQTTAKQARLAADRLRRIIGNTPFAIGEGAGSIHVSVSVGVAVSDAGTTPDLPLTQLCSCADRALYRAKTAGRNQVAMSQSAA
ncbi:diguanylate cyclase [Yoonia sp.]|uniref:diguanylate cyclase n=1 Tax=Yoonia sp. TaxID=2212373 RepID=UPI002FDAE03D